jgi:O-antigen/teichoic acid export membrane protein
MSLARRFLKSSVFRTVETVINIVVGLFMLPFLVSQLGETMYGIWVLVGSITASFYILDLGFSSAVQRFISDALALNNKLLGKEVVSTAWLVYLVLSAFICVLTGIACLFVPVLANPDSPHELIQILLLITGLNLAIQFPVKAFAGIAAFHTRYDLLSISKIILKLLSTAITVAAVLKGYGVIAVALIAMFGDVCSNLIYRQIARFLEPELRVSLKYVTKKQTKQLINFSGWTLITDSCRMLQERSDIWVIAAFLPVNQLTIYYVGLRLATYTFQLLARAVSMDEPLFMQDFSNGDKEGMRQKLFLFTRLNFLFAALAVSGFATTGIDVITLWMGEEFAVREAYLVCLTLLIGKMLLFVSMPINSVFLACYKPRIMSWVSVIETTIMGMLLIVFVGVFNLGIIGAAISVLVSFSILRPIILPILVARELNFQTIYYFTKLIPLSMLGGVVGTTTQFIPLIFGENLDAGTTLALEISLFFTLTLLLVPFFLNIKEKSVITDALGKYSILLTWPDQFKNRA